MAHQHLNQQQNEQEQSTKTYRVHDSTSNVTFHDGIMRVDGRPQAPTRVEHWESSNGITNYTTVEWRDPATGEYRTSCNCPGWAIKKSGKPRQCCHTQDMEGKKPCRKKKVESVAITSIDLAVSEIPDMIDGRELRGILLD